jgi:hypothetical protein
MLFAAPTVLLGSARSAGSRGRCEQDGMTT